MIALYRLITTLLYWIAYPYGRTRASSGDHVWQGRLALLSTFEQADIWLHAASVGESKVVGFLVGALLKQKPELRLHVTTVTRAGFEAAAKSLKGKADVSVFPLDAPAPMRTMLQLIRPRILAIAETEIWPSLIIEASEQKVKIVQFNARMSERGVRRYLRVKGAISRLLGHYDRFFVKSELDRERFSTFGIDPSSAEVTGDMKFDAPLTLGSEGRNREVRDWMGMTETAFLFVAGSTRKGEDGQLVELYKAIREDIPGFTLVLAPRHLERLKEISSTLDQSGCDYYIYEPGSRLSGCDGKIVIIDQMGILMDLYQAADIAFVGGTLVDKGGHNILEPVWCGKPVVYGPYLSNVAEAAEYIESNGFGARVREVGELRNLVRDFAEGRRVFESMSEEDRLNSPTTTVARYLVKLLNNV